MFAGGRFIEEKAMAETNGFRRPLLLSPQTDITR